VRQNTQVVSVPSTPFSASAFLRDLLILTVAYVIAYLARFPNAELWTIVPGGRPCCSRRSSPA
jgi:hypothetical protein